MAKADLEVWENASHSQLFVLKHDPRGNLIHEPVPGKRRITLTPDERRMNQDLVASPELDWFKNGTLVPVRLVDADEDTEGLKTNVNALNDEDIKKLFKAPIKTFTEKVNGIGNPIAIRRLLEVAGELDATVKQVEALHARLADLAPEVSETPLSAATAGNVGADTRRRAVTPK